MKIFALEPSGQDENVETLCYWLEEGVFKAMEDGYVVIRKSVHFRSKNLCWEYTMIQKKKKPWLSDTLVAFNSQLIDSYFR